jgi:hypothetical protein
MNSRYTTNYLLRSDLEQAAFCKRKSSIKLDILKKEVELVQQGFMEEEISEAKEKMWKQGKHGSLEKLSFSSKEDIIDFLRETFGNVSRKVALKILEDNTPQIKIVSRKIIKKDSYFPWKPSKTIKTYHFEIENRVIYEDMFNIPACLLRPIKAFKYTQNFKNSELRLGLKERTLLIYLENNRRIFYHNWEVAKKENPSIKWKPSLYLSQKSMAEDLGWSVEQVKYSMKKLKLYFGKDFYRERTEKEEQSRKIKGCWNFQINLPPMRKWNAIIMKKIVMYTKSAGDSVLKKRFPLETYRYLVSAQRRTKQYDCYAENFMNDSNKEYERLCSLASRIRSYLQEKKEVTADFLKSLIFDKRPLTYRKRVPQPIVKEYYRKLYKAA